MIRSFTDLNFVETLYWHALRKHFSDVYFSPVHYANSQIYSRQTNTFSKVMSIKQIFLFLNSFLRWMFVCVVYTFSSIATRDNSRHQNIVIIIIFIIIINIIIIVITIIIGFTGKYSNNLQENTCLEVFNTSIFLWNLGNF